MVLGTAQVPTDNAPSETAIAETRVLIRARDPRTAHSRVDECPSSPVGLDEVVVRIRRVGILVQELHVRVRRRRIEVEVVLLDVFAVIPLAVGKPIEPLFEDRVTCRFGPGIPGHWKIRDESDDLPK
jgi:hypothetical protein